jgi:hypothetical protein
MAHTAIQSMDQTAQILIELIQFNQLNVFLMITKLVLKIMDPCASPQRTLMTDLVELKIRISVLLMISEINA